LITKQSSEVLFARVVYLSTAIKLLRMKNILLVLSFYLPSLLPAQTINSYFESIRNNASELTAFFSQMPKGGDLHHHFSGSVYAETFLDKAIEKDFFVNESTLDISEQKPDGEEGWVQFSALQKNGRLFDYKERLLRRWSARDYNESDYPSHRQFFESFDHFSPATRYTMDEGLKEIKRRAIAENVSYIETMLRTVPCNKDVSDLSFLNPRLRDYARLPQQTLTDKLLDSLYSVIRNRNVGECAQQFVKGFLEPMHSRLHLDDSLFTIRYQTFVIRTMDDPVTLFRNIIVSFEAADISPLLVGVNIVAPEHYDIAMQDYQLHMQMFKYCHSRYPNVKYSMHAGELALGLVRPEDLTWHIWSAVHDAGAMRIGHGVDLPYEKDSYALLDYMRQKPVPVEINLYSNEFILKVKDDRHPVVLYKKYNVPIVISTDDEGVLRTNLIEQYVLLAKRYPGIKYADIKKFVYNSIQYSFIEEPVVKQKLTARLDADFKKFEGKVLNSVTPKR
jgi:adenosine deaminase